MMHEGQGRVEVAYDVQGRSPQVAPAKRTRLQPLLSGGSTGLDHSAGVIRTLTSGAMDVAGRKMK